MAETIAQLAANDLTDITSPENDDNGLLLWPLPANNVLHVGYSSKVNPGLSTLSIYNVDGGLVMTKEIANDTELNVSHLSSGIYMLKLSNGEESITKKFVIDRSK